MCDIPMWPTESPKWTNEYLKLLQDGSINPITDSTVDYLISLSNKFPVKFPIETNRCKTLVSSVKREILDRNIKSAYPLVHENALKLYADFLLFKRNHGTQVEKNLYENMSVVNFVERLLTKRAVMFMGKWDSWLLLNNTKGAGKWDTIGKDNEKSPLLLKNCLSYDEIKLSVFLSVSSYNYFINNGTRKNKGIVSKSRSDIQDEGIVIGIIGARFKKKNFMECQEMLITKTQNTLSNGYGPNRKDSLPEVFSKFYDEPSLTYEDVVTKIKSDKSGRFTSLPNEEYFDNVVYSKRLILSFDTLLIEANFRAKEATKQAYIHVVGIGLGVWRASDHQNNVFIETFLKRISALGSNLNNVSDVDFSYFGDGITCKDYKEGHLVPIENHPNKGVVIHVSKRDPFTKIESGKILVVSYAWDGNALPGNEFWKGQLGSTGDSSTASSTQISELHNPHINKIVTASNLMVVTSDSLIPIEKYINKFRKNSEDDSESKSQSAKKRKN